VAPSGGPEDYTVSPAIALAVQGLGSRERDGEEAEWGQGCEVCEGTSKLASSSCLRDMICERDLRCAGARASPEAAAREYQV